MAKKSKKSNTVWIIQIVMLTFIISMIFSSISETFISKINLIGGIIILFIFIGLGVLFDMIGVAFTSVDEEPFHAKSSRKVIGASTAVKLIKNADKVSSFCNDVVGDICGILSGSAGIMIATSVVNKFHLNTLVVSLVVTSLIASLTIGTKALGKGIAIKNNKKIVFKFSKVLSIFYR